MVGRLTKRPTDIAGINQASFELFRFFLQGRLRRFFVPIHRRADVHLGSRITHTDRQTQKQSHRHTHRDIHTQTRTHTHTHRVGSKGISMIGGWVGVKKQIYWGTGCDCYAEKNCCDGRKSCARNFVCLLSNLRFSCRFVQLAADVTRREEKVFLAQGKEPREC